MKVITAVVNNPTFIEIQYHTLRKYLRGVDAYEFIVFNDAKTFPDPSNEGDLTLRLKISETCKALGIQCIEIPNDHHQYLEHRHADVFNNHILRYQLEHPDHYLLLDSDMFLIAELDIAATYAQYNAAVLLQSRPDWQLHYIWPGLCYFDMTKIQAPHLLNWAQGRGGDTGGMMEAWLRTQMGPSDVIPSTDDLRWKKDQTFHTSTLYFIPHLWSCSWNLAELPAALKENAALVAFLQEDPRNPKNGKFFCEIYDQVFLHYRAGGNWNAEGMALHNALTLKLKEALLHG
jgi:hypothetical protein